DDTHLVVHEGDAALVGRGAVRLERAFRGFERAHWASSFGFSRLRSDRMPLKRLFAASRPSSNRPGFSSGCDHSGCSARAAAIAFGVYLASHSSRMPLLWSANSRSA